MKNGNIILVLVTFLVGLNVIPLDLAARDIAAELDASFSVQPKHAPLSRLHEISQTSLRSKIIKGKKYHHPTQRPDDPFSVHHARPFFIFTYEEQDVHPILTVRSNVDTPIYIGCIHPSDYISKIFHPPTV